MTTSQLVCTHTHLMVADHTSNRRARHDELHGHHLRQAMLVRMASRRQHRPMLWAGVCKADLSLDCNIGRGDGGVDACSQALGQAYLRRAVRSSHHPGHRRLNLLEKSQH